MEILGKCSCGHMGLLEWNLLEHNEQGTLARLSCGKCGEEAPFAFLVEFDDDEEDEEKENEGGIMTAWTIDSYRNWLKNVIAATKSIFGDNPVYTGPHLGFSWSPCELCGSTLGGDRYEVGGWTYPEGGDHNTILVTCEVCTDCYHWMEYGDLDDQSLIDLDADDRAKVRQEVYGVGA